MDFEYIQNDLMDLVKVLSDLQENYSEETQEYFIKAVDLANELSILTERINYLIIEEDTEESFIEDLEVLKYNYRELDF